MPIGACLVAEAVERDGHAVRVLDLMFATNPVHALESELGNFKPDIVGLSIRNIDNNDMQNPVAFFQDLKPLSGRMAGMGRHVAECSIWIEGNWCL